jgi:hypothetical protein
LVSPCAHRTRAALPRLARIPRLPGRLVHALRPTGNDGPLRHQELA